MSPSTFVVMTTFLETTKNVLDIWRVVNVTVYNMFVVPVTVVSCI